jgi:hypothetical protein
VTFYTDGKEKGSARRSVDGGFNEYSRCIVFKE